MRHLVAERHRAAVVDALRALRQIDIADVAIRCDVS
jgi:hypothetical protein